MEQTSSTAYPNLLVVDYLKKARRADPETMMKAEHYLSVGYQKILTFQNSNGGFGWWAGGQNPVVWVSAYGIQQLNDMSRVLEVDRAVIERGQQWLTSQQDKDGAWRIPGHTHGVSIEKMANPEIGLTAYVAWTLAESGFKGEELSKALTYLKDHLDEVTENTYALALTANALAAAEPKGKTTRLVLETLEGMKKTDDRGVFWPTDGQTLSYARGDSATVEVSALVVQAMQQGGGHTTTVNKALSFLVAVRGASGAWGSTQATILALKALVRSLSGEQLDEPVLVDVKVNGKTQKITITPDQSDVLRLLDFGSVTKKGRNTVTLDPNTKTPMMFQVVSRHFMPWKPNKPSPASPLAIALTYDRAELKTDDLLTAHCHLEYHGNVTTYMVIIDLGIPPGFTIDRTPFAKLVASNKIEKFTITPRQVTVYLGGLKPAQTLDFNYTLRAKYPIKAKTPRSIVYEYYTPENRAVAEPVELLVK